MLAKRTCQLELFYVLKTYGIEKLAFLATWGIRPRVQAVNKFCDRGQTITILGTA
jgi:hypothetical protein